MRRRVGPATPAALVRFVPLIGFIVAFTVAAIVPAGDLANPLRAACATLLILVLPGWATVGAAFEKSSLDWPELTVLTVGVSISLAVLGGLVLNATPFGLTQHSWLAYELVIISVSTAVNWIRRSGETRRDRPGLRLSFGKSSMLAGALLITIGVYALDRSASIGEPRSMFTELSMLPSPGSDVSSFRIGVANHERRSMRYELVISTGPDVIASFQPISLTDGHSWRVTVRIPKSRMLASTRVVATLYTSGSTPYRQVFSSVGGTT